ncbi:uncharacterized protein METZ01_LOCUS92563 [marine metagenome]|uniref:Uncharacterized protein n=1 Tax=marine metagenome TaxID=408172 RepID=A0A381VH64_9ZZZZ
MMLSLPFKDAGFQNDYGIKSCRKAQVMRRHNHSTAAGNFIKFFE